MTAGGDPGLPGPESRTAGPCVEVEDSAINLRLQGDAVRRRVMGNRYVEDARDSARDQSGELFQDYVTSHLWGAVWSRPGLDLRSRSLVTLGILTALRAEQELVAHVRAAVRNGVTESEITEVVIHAAGYCGTPAAISAMRAVDSAFDTPDI